MVERSVVLDRAYGALAHPTRRAMLERLQAGGMRVTDLAQPFDVSLAAISKHVAVLESASLIHRTVDGRDHLLAVNPDPLVEAGEWIDTYRRFWQSRLDALDTHLRRRR